MENEKGKEYTCPLCGEVYDNLKDRDDCVMDCREDQYVQPHYPDAQEGSIWDY